MPKGRDREGQTNVIWLEIGREGRPFGNQGLLKGNERYKLKLYSSFAFSKVNYKLHPLILSKVHSIQSLNFNFVQLSLLCFNFVQFNPPVHFH